jgi:hypothetical protein
MTTAADLHSIALRFRELARTEANGPLRKRLINLGWRCDQMAKGIAAADAARARFRAAAAASDLSETGC